MPNVTGRNLPIYQRDAFDMNPSVVDGRTKAWLEGAALEELSNVQLTWLTDSNWHLENLTFDISGCQKHSLWLSAVKNYYA